MAEKPGILHSSIATTQLLNNKKGGKYESKDDKEISDDSCGGFFVLYMLPVMGHAAVPQSINYQGKLTDADGNPVADGDYLMGFSIYDVPTGGAPLWSESQTVTVTNGIYDVILGQPGNLLDPDGFEAELYLGITVGTDSEMTPRQRLTSSPFAMKAAKADNADTLDDMDFLDFALSSHDHPWEEIFDRPPGLDDGDDVGITSETDPTVLSSVKDGVSWGELSGVPAGFADGVDNEGVTTSSDYGRSGVAANLYEQTSR